MKKLILTGIAAIALNLCTAHQSHGLVNFDAPPQERKAQIKKLYNVINEKESATYQSKEGLLEVVFSEEVTIFYRSKVSQYYGINFFSSLPKDLTDIIVIYPDNGTVPKESEWSIYSRNEKSGKEQIMHIKKYSEKENEIWRGVAYSWLIILPENDANNLEKIVKNIKHGTKFRIASNTPNNEEGDYTKIYSEMSRQLYIGDKLLVDKQPGQHAKVYTTFNK